MMIVEVLTFRDNQDVIQVNEGKLVWHVPKGVLYGVLESQQGVAKPKQHDQILQLANLVWKAVFH